MHLFKEEADSGATSNYALFELLSLKLNQEKSMKKVIYTLAIFSAVAVGCGGGASDDHSGHDHGTDNATENHDHMNHDANSGPALLAVPSGARVFFANVNEGDTLTNPAIIEFGVEGMTVEPAGELKEGFGHHHLLINEAVIPTSEIVPANETNIHYGGGQTVDTLDLPTGNVQLTMQFADGLHRSYGEQMSATINVVVAE